MEDMEHRSLIRYIHKLYTGNLDTKLDRGKERKGGEGREGEGCNFSCPSL